MTIAFTIPGEAVPWARAGARGAQRFTPPKQRSYAGALKMFCQNAMRGRAPLDGPVELSVLAIYAWPKSMSPRKRALPGAEWKTSRPDVDNLAKIVADALNTVAWGDDAQVASKHEWKKYGDVPCLQVRIRSLLEEAEQTTVAALAAHAEAEREVRSQVASLRALCR